MYQLVGKSKKHVMFNAVTEKYTPKTGQNKDILYISLIIGFIALLIGLYLLYRMQKKKDNAPSQSFGYKL
jgi:LPXTG-motif cell wall-anchored protein